MSEFFQRRIWKILSHTTFVGGLALAIFLGIWWVDLFRETPPSEYHLKGKFGPVVDWPLTPIHEVLLPDGRVMSYGTDLRGRQGAQYHYDVWDPRKGTGWDAHLTLSNTTGTDIFCSGQVLVPDHNTVLVVGGDRTVHGERNWSSPDINYFDYQTNVLRSAGRTMERPRWYPAVITLANGDIVVAGGRLDPLHDAPLPELYSPKTGWRTLPGAESAPAFGDKNWNYPRLWLKPDGTLFVLSVTGEGFIMDPTGEGHIRSLHKFAIWPGHPYIPSVMFRPGKILALRWGGKSYEFDINGKDATVQPESWSGLARVNASLTTMADGDVFLNGGGMLNNAAMWFLAPNYEARIWHAQTGIWTKAAIAKRMRMYHSTSLLLPDATILTGGGGAPGPQENLNAEIYYPPYLFKKDGSGDFAERPVITQAPAIVQVGQTFTIQSSDPKLAKLHFIRAGSVTHTNNFDQRFLPLTFKSIGPGQYQTTLPNNPNVVPPGYYLLFALNQAGVPSVAKIIRVVAD